MNEITNSVRCYDGRITGGLKGTLYDVSSYSVHSDESMVLTDADLVALLESGR